MSFNAPPKPPPELFGKPSESQKGLKNEPMPRHIPPETALSEGSRGVSGLPGAGVHQEALAGNILRVQDNPGPLTAIGRTLAEEAIFEGKSRLIWADSAGPGELGAADRRSEAVANTCDFVEEGRFDAFEATAVAAFEG